MIEREKQRHRQRKKQAPCREPDMGLNPRTPGSRPGPKAGTKPLSHPGCPCLFFKFYLFTHERHTERETETQAEEEAGSMQGARHGTQSQDSRIMPWAKGRRQTAEPPRDPLN